MVSIVSYRKGQTRYSLKYKQVAIKGFVQLGPNPFQQIKRLSFFLSLVWSCSALSKPTWFSFKTPASSVRKFGFLEKYFLYLFNFLSSDYEVEFSVPDYCDRVVILYQIRQIKSKSFCPLQIYWNQYDSRTGLAGVLKLNQMGLDKAEQLHTNEREKTQPFWLRR